MTSSWSMSAPHTQPPVRTPTVRRMKINLLSAYGPLLLKNFKRVEWNWRFCVAFVIFEYDFDVI